MAEKWTSGVRDLDARQTRQRLAALIDECKFVAVGLERLQGEGLRDQVTSTELTLLRAAKAEIERLAGMLAEYRSGPAPAPYDAFAAARARAEAKAAATVEGTPATVAEPAPVAPTRPQIPVRGMRLPRLTPGRPS